MNSSSPVPKQLPDLSVLLLAMIFAYPSGSWCRTEPITALSSKRVWGWSILPRFVSPMLFLLSVDVVPCCSTTRQSSTASCIISPLCKGIWFLESGNFLLAKSNIFFRENFASGIRNTAQGIQNPTNNWNPKCKVHCHSQLESRIHSV